MFTAAETLPPFPTRPRILLDHRATQREKLEKSEKEINRLEAIRGRNKKERAKYHATIDVRAALKAGLVRIEGDLVAEMAKPASKVHLEEYNEKYGESSSSSEEEEEDGNGPPEQEEDSGPVEQEE
jgi:hypothetical protein